MIESLLRQMPPILRTHVFVEVSAESGEDEEAAVDARVAKVVVATEAAQSTKIKKGYVAQEQQQQNQSKSASPVVAVVSDPASHERALLVVALERPTSILKKKG